MKPAVGVRPERERVRSGSDCGKKDLVYNLDGCPSGGRRRKERVTC